MTQAAVAEAVRQGIMGGDLAPGQRLVEAELCAQLGASRGHVRAALVDLEYEGLVERIANRGARVRLASLREALQIAEVRLEVENLCVARAAERISDAEMRELRDSARRLQEPRTLADVRGFARVANRIFASCLRIAAQPVAEEVLLRLHARNSGQRFRLLDQPGRTQIAAASWLQLVEAICSRQPDAAQRALRELACSAQEAMRSLPTEGSLT